jgi:predicted nucleic acid-binding protein
MSMLVLLDAGPLGSVSNPRGTTETTACVAWVDSLLTAGARVIVPEIADYEVRRELLRANRSRGVARLESIKRTLDYLPLTTEVMLLAAEFWAETRRQGRPTADDKALDGDMILAAQAVLAAGDTDTVVVATTNVGHLAHFVDARPWRQIYPPEVPGSSANEHP